MKAAVIKEYGKPLLMTDVPKPTIAPNEVLVKIKATGFCHTDLHSMRGHWAVVIDGHKECNVNIVGHEGVGEIVEVGEAVTTKKVGDRVGIPWMNSVCGNCEPCLTGYETWCENPKYTSVHVNGTFAEYAKVSERYAIPIPKEIPDVEAAPLLCAGITAYGGFKRLIEGNIRPAKPVAVIGAGGGLGHYGTQVAKAFGYKVVGIDIGAEKLKLVEELGADFAVDAKDAEQFVKDKGKVAASVVFTPVIAGYELAFKITKMAGMVVVIGCPSDAAGSIPITPLMAVINGFRIIPWMVGAPQDFKEFFPLCVDGKVRSTISVVEPFEKVNEVAEKLEKGVFVGRATLTF